MAYIRLLTTLSLNKKYTKVCEELWKKDKLVINELFEGKMTITINTILKNKSKKPHTIIKNLIS